MVVLFTITVFLAAALLFGVQPMVAKALLPGFGGGSSVWTTCMLFFQTLLIGGYLYAHLLLTRVPRKAQMMVHACVLAVALIAGWLFRDPTPPHGASEFPVPWLLGQLFLIAGLPYFAISSAGPLLQGWFARTGHRRAHDPYFLYAASNAGSFVGLLAYPFVVEPTLGLDVQRYVWLSMFAGFGALALLCVRLTRPSRLDEFGHTPDGADVDTITWKRRLWWVFLAFVPSSTLLGVTTHLTTDVASFPLLWVVPLALYLLTMVVAFSGRAPAIVRSGVRPMVVAIIAAWVLLVAWGSGERLAPLAGNLAVQLAVLLTVGFYGHSRLAVDRPHARHLTEFYLLMSVGGALGGLLNGVVAPLLFNDAYEYHLGLVCALLMLPALPRGGMSARRWWSRRLWPPLASMGAVFAVAFLLPRIELNPVVQLFALIVPPALIVYMGWRDRVSCAGAFAFPLVAVILSGLINEQSLLKERTFYGVHRVFRKIENGAELHTLINGTTLHGLQAFSTPQLEGVPLGYYHPDGPCGGLMKITHELRPDHTDTCVIGLGTGALAAYNRPSDRMVFMEIDPSVERLARDGRYFTYLNDARGTVEVRLGDGRLLLETSQREGEKGFDLIIVDAFNSDSIPVHLLTMEALRLYLDRLSEGGVVAFHISNRHLDLFPLLFELARGEHAYILMDNDPVSEEVRATDQRFASMWVAMTRSRSTGELMLKGTRFEQYTPRWTTRPWTDQYSNLLSVIGRD